MDIRKKAFINIIILFIVLFIFSSICGWGVISKEAVNMSAEEGIKTLRAMVTMIDKNKLQEVTKSKSIED